MVYLCALFRQELLMAEGTWGDNIRPQRSGWSPEDGRVVIGAGDTEVGNRRTGRRLLIGDRIPLAEICSHGSTCGAYFWTG